MPLQTPTPESSDAAGFAATRWTLVLTAARGSSSSLAADALAELCRVYWYPLYAFLRRRGNDPHDAEDLTQDFFAHLLAQQFLAKVDREKGKFRAFLLASLKNFLADARDRAQAQKRGGGRSPIPLDSLAAETRYRLEPATELTPEKLFEKQWALALLEQVLSRLQQEMAADGKAAMFDELQSVITGGRSDTYAAIAEKLQMTEGAVKVAAHRLRRRYRELLREEIAHTVAGPEEVEDEIRYLLSCL
jgi:RNA polymerase sigma-70 factor (ECF subfamily)